MRPTPICRDATALMMKSHANTPSDNRAVVCEPSQIGWYFESESRSQDSVRPSLEIANGCWVWRRSHFISMLAARLAEVHPKHDSNSMPAAMRKALLIIDQCPAP